MPYWLKNVSIINQSADRHLEPWLNEQLQAYHIDTISDPALANYWLIIISDHFDEQIKSISSSTTPRQYLLIYSVRFKLQRANSADIIPDSDLQVTRQATINSDRILGSTDEENLLKDEMRQDAALQIVTRLGRAHDH